jgi:hypothetical protein
MFSGQKSDYLEFRNNALAGFQPINLAMDGETSARAEVV